MAGACPVPLSVAVSTAGGMGACGALLMNPDAIRNWVDEFRIQNGDAFQLNTWIPDSEPERNEIREQAVRDFLEQWGSEIPEDAADASTPDFNEQCKAMLELKPTGISSIMGIYNNEMVERMKSSGIAWFATATTVAEAKLAEQSGADVIVAQGMEAGGHRGVFKSDQAESTLAGLFSLLPAVVDAVRVPVVATGGIADSRGIAAAITLGASAVQIGSGFLRCPEADIPSAWADGIGAAIPDNTTLTRAFTGRAARSVSTAYTQAASESIAPAPTPYPIQRNLTKAMTGAARQANDLSRMQAWSGQSGFLAQAIPAKKLTQQLWQDTLRHFD